MKRLFPASLFVLAGMLLQLVGCKDDEVSLPDEGGLVIEELPVRMTEAAYNEDNT